MGQGDGAAFDDGPPDRLVVAGGTGAIAVSEVQPAGRNRLTVEEWVRGRGIAAGRRFE